ncbi:SDR family NAD(P)-dependent oxidoreductase [Phycicoccus sp. BSK3Z-2]|uniref:SDR family NAD(P)-dependent oxidoreductase n=1 Tax=Phycicoccus avicenniae TaxID=2828860 RepID=A0A941D591_9MICO|nr:SDR family NAD(P)-dependent oxidoreductase [Phycicoccus avicenniae]MBR7741793.1 SDR family NAD(P)-dependent oxidoreductase [Phycicoccus avicenniae]
MERHTPPARGALVLGASSGIGRATALRLAGEGVPLVLAGRDEDALAAVADACRDRGGEADVATLDVRDDARVREVVDDAARRFGDGLAVVHSAAVVAYGPFDEVPDEVMDEVVAAGVLGTVSVCRAALRAFRREGGGHLVVVGSLLGQIATPYMSGYVLSKWAVHGLVRTLQIETRDRAGTSVSLVSPGGIDTPVYRQAATVMGRHGSPPPPVRSADAVARRVVHVLRHPRRQTHVGPANALAITGFRLLPPVYDVLVTPLMRALGLTPWSGLDPSPGNVHEPRHPAPSDPPEDPVSERRRLHRPRVSRTVAASAETVWEVLADGWQYSTWVVGAARVREVDAGWPNAESRVHHSVGPWPAMLSDVTVAEEAHPPHHLVLRARGWPAGEATVEIDVVPDGPRTCTVSIGEDAATGPGRLVPLPLRQLAILPRNRETLRRLGLLAEGRQREQDADGKDAPADAAERLTEGR